VRWRPHRFAVFALFLATASAQERNFVAGLGGFAILSPAAVTDFRQTPLTSSYRPETGPAFNLAAGRHFNNWISVQGNYIWNRNTVFLTGTEGTAFVEHRNRLSHQQFVFDGLLYFRPLTSRIRPYLSVGTGGVRASRSLEEVTAIRPPIVEPTASATAWYAGIRVAVGIDLMWMNGWGFRYSFSETVSPNLAGRSLVPPASGSLMNFQNLFGVVKYF
jgi:hypothetical protein